MAPTAPRPPHVVYLGRIHPKKNIAALVDAWTMLNAAGALPDDARLTIAGWGDPADVVALETRLVAAPPSAAVVGPQFGDDKARLLAGARVLALPSHSEGLPVAILEAWAAGTPVLMSSECNLPVGFSAGAAIDCGVTAQSVASALGRVLTLPAPAWLAMAAAAQQLAAGPFSAAAIAQQWEAAYASLMQRTPI